MAGTGIPATLIDAFVWEKGYDPTLASLKPERIDKLRTDVAPILDTRLCTRPQMSRLGAVRRFAVRLDDKGLLQGRGATVHNARADDRLALELHS